MKASQKIKLLLIMEQCNPEWTSVPLVAYNFYQGIRELVDVTLVTHIRNRGALERRRGRHEIIYIRESRWIQRYYALIHKLTERSGVNWPLQHALSYPVYAQFNGKVFKQFAQKVRSQTYDLVHVMTPILPRYPVKIIQACQSVPFILGPVNGGVPFPRGFKKIAHKEFAHYNFLRIFTWLLPGYQRTYQQADLILAASEYTLNMLKQRFNLPSSRLELFHENGIFFENFPKNKTEDSETFEIVFVGRLVPYKGADMLLEAIAGMQDHLLQRTHLTIVGDGPEKKILKEQANALGVDQYTTFAGWVAHHDISLYYKRANVFCFPSIREFGGAVALEAMAYGLPCVVPDYAGLSEYVTTDTGFKIEPRSRQFLISEMIEKLQILFQDSQLRQKMSQKARERAQEYQWSQKSMQLLDIYRRICR